jgi:hypothetical protein
MLFTSHIILVCLLTLLDAIDLGVSFPYFRIGVFFLDLDIGWLFFAVKEGFEPPKAGSYRVPLLLHG